MTCRDYPVGTAIQYGLQVLKAGRTALGTELIRQRSSVAQRRTAVLILKGYERPS